MRYAELIADLAQRTRTVIQSGTEGSVSIGSHIFRVPTTTTVAAEPNYFLRIPKGDLAGTYEITFALQNEIRCETPFYQDASGIEWEILEKGISEGDIKRLLNHLPDAIMAMEIDERVRTPLGTFTKERKARKRVRDPQGNWTFSPERIQARIRPGKRLQQKLEEPAKKLEMPNLDQYTLPWLPPTEDPEGQ